MKFEMLETREQTMKMILSWYELNPTAHKLEPLTFTMSTSQERWQPLKDPRYESNSSSSLGYVTFSKSESAHRSWTVALTITMTLRCEQSDCSQILNFDLHPGQRPRCRPPGHSCVLICSNSNNILGEVIFSQSESVHESLTLMLALTLSRRQHPSHPNSCISYWTKSSHLSRRSDFPENQKHAQKILSFDLNLDLGTSKGQAVLRKLWTYYGWITGHGMSSLGLWQDDLKITKLFTNLFFQNISHCIGLFWKLTYTGLDMSCFRQAKYLLGTSWLLKKESEYLKRGIFWSVVTCEKWPSNCKIVRKKEQGYKLKTCIPWQTMAISVLSIIILSLHRCSVLLCNDIHVPVTILQTYT